MAQLVAPVEVDPLAIRGMAERLAGVDGLFELTALLRQGDGGLGGQQPPLAAPDSVEVAAHQPGRALGGQLLHSAHRDAGTDGDADAFPLLAQQPRPVVVEPGGEIEGETIAPIQVDGHQRGTGAQSKLDEARLPGAVLDPLGAKARHLAGGKDHQRPFARQVFSHRQNGAPVGLAAQVVHRQQQGAQRRQLGQQLIGHYLDVRPDAAEQAQQGQPVEGADGVIGDDDDPAAGRNVLELGLAHPVVEVELGQRLLDEVESAQVRMTRGKALKRLLVQQPAQPLPEQGAQQAVGREAGQVLL